MSDQTPATPEPDPTADQSAASEGLPPEGLPPAEPVSEAPGAVAPEPPAAPGGEASPPPQAPAYQAPEAPAAAAAPAAWPAAYPPPGGPAYPAAPVPGAPAPAAAPAQTSSNAVVALILAVVSWAVCPIIPAIVALVFASNATKEIAASGGRLQGTGLITAARIVSWVNIGVWAAAIVVGGFFLVLAIVAGSMGAN